MLNVKDQFDAVYKQYYNKILIYITRIIGQNEAEDLTQEVFIKVNNKLQGLKDESRLSSWLYKIALNTVRDRIRMNSSRVESKVVETAIDETDMTRYECPGSVTSKKKLHDSPESKIIHNEMVECYIDYVNKLPANYYKVYMLSEFEQLSNEEIANRLSISLNTVKIQLHRARTMLNEQLRKNCQYYHDENGDLMAEPKCSI